MRGTDGPRWPREPPFALDRGGNVSLVEQLRHRIADAIFEGTLALGARLPSWSDLASQLGVARGTVRQAYSDLADAQLIVHEGHYAVVTNRPGKQKLRLKFAVKLSGATDGAHFALVATPAAINTLSVAGLPEKQTVRIAEATQLSSERDRISFRLPAADRIEFELIPERAVVPPTPSRWKLDVQALVQFAEGKLNYSARLAANAENGSGIS